MRKNSLKITGTSSILIFLIFISYTETKAFEIKKPIKALIKKHNKCQYNKPDSAVCYLNQALEIAKD